MSKVYLNGAFVNDFEAVVPVTDRGLLYGDGLFETMRAYDGTIFRVGEHINRLKRSAATLSIPLPVRPADLEAATRELLTLNDLTDA